jgi:hypothetical protein
VTFVLGLKEPTWMLQGVMAAVVGTLMALDGYYLGYRRHQEDQVRPAISPSLLRCPFVMGILSKTGVRSQEGKVSPVDTLVGEAGRRG